MTTVGVKKALNCSRLLSIIRKHSDLEFLISSWSVESHTFDAAWGERGPTLEDMAAHNAANIQGKECHGCEPW